MRRVLKGTLSVNRRGITRTVILTRRWAIKIPTIRGLGHIDKGARIASFCRGVLANRSELEWSGIEGLNPVVWSLRGLINVSRRAAPVPAGGLYDEYEVDDGLSLTQRAKDAYAAITADFVPIGDRKSDNIGVVDGRVVWIDFDSSWNGQRPDGRPALRDTD